MNIDFEVLCETGEYIGRKGDDLTEMLRRLEKTKKELDMYIPSEQSDDKYAELAREGYKAYPLPDLGNIQKHRGRGMRAHVRGRICTQAGLSGGQ